MYIYIFEISNFYLIIQVVPLHRNVYLKENCRNVFYFYKNVK